MKSKPFTDAVLESILPDEKTVPNNGNTNILHGMCHVQTTYKNCYKCIPMDNNATRSPIIDKGVGHVGIATKNTKLPNEALRLSSFLKILAVLFIVCDALYLHVNLQNIKDSLKSSSNTIENLESQLKFTKLSYESFKADINYLMYLNRMFTKDINAKIELLVKLNKLFVDRADTSLNSIIDIIRHQKSNDDKITQIVNKREKRTNNLNNINGTILFKKNYQTDRFEIHSARNDDKMFGLIFRGNNVSSLGNFDFEKNEIDSEIMLNNSSFSKRQFVFPESLRTKRQTTDSSQSNNRGPLLAHFRGAQPEALIQDGGVIAPWFGDLAVSGDYINRNALLRDGKAKIEVTEKGLYLIYAQVYYLTSNQLNSFSINIQSNKKVTERVIAMCSTEAAVQGMSEVSCYTSVVHQLDPGDKIFLVQRERYRRVIFREGHTFLGVVVLNNPPKC